MNPTHWIILLHMHIAGEKNIENKERLLTIADAKSLQRNNKNNSKHGRQT